MSFKDILMEDIKISSDKKAKESKKEAIKAASKTLIGYQLKHNQFQSNFVITDIDFEKKDGGFIGVLEFYVLNEKNKYSFKASHLELIEIKSPNISTIEDFDDPEVKFTISFLERLMLHKAYRRTLAMSIYNTAKELFKLSEK